jgi:hypothetical protein
MLVHSGEQGKQDPNFRELIFIQVLGEMSAKKKKNERPYQHQTQQGTGWVEQGNVTGTAWQLEEASMEPGAGWSQEETNCSSNGTPAGRTLSRPRRVSTCQGIPGLGGQTRVSERAALVSFHIYISTTPPAPLASAAFSHICSEQYPCVTTFQDICPYFMHDQKYGLK